MDPATTAVMVGTMCCGIGPAALALAGAIGLGLAAKAFHMRGRGQGGYGGGQGGYGRRRRSAFKESGGRVRGRHGYGQLGISPEEEPGKYGEGHFSRDLEGPPAAQKSDGNGGRRRRQSRRKRSPTEESQAIEMTLDLIRQEDVTGCGLRLVCELASIDRNQLTVEELEILDLVGKPSVYPGHGVLPSKGFEDYREAKYRGLAGGDCWGSYPHCPLNGTELMDAVVAFLP